MALWRYKMPDCEEEEEEEEESGHLTSKYKIKL